MRVPRLFVPARLREGACVDLPGEVAGHLGRVLRLGPGADLLLFNGEGGEWQAIIEVLERGRVGVRVGSHRPGHRESPLHLTLAQGISRGERMDYTLQKAVELGVSRIVPIASERSVVRLSAERGERRAQHWAKVVQAASEQCGRTRVPRLLRVATMDEWLSGVVPGLKLLLIRKEGACRLSELAPDPSITLLIGPEGGFAAEEATAAERAGYRALRLGPRVLRTETAAVAALCALQALWGDLG
ncbi:MAG: 16S rRNA (uracil(1498)-N(3))-methyltransferase [Pseudomonadota bacterium]|nr:16S rRNA (uracil(1498)-N(3))-methyltransferase [Pseudomonadota bacterium]